jgi:L-ascorbate metabolism protein UlaG (beta-lactamase superfamily)
VLLTHRHNDHVGDALAVLKMTDAMLVANFEICNYLAGQGANGDKVNPGLHGGTVDCGGFTTAFVNAMQSSSFGMKDGQNVYLGNPTGLVLHFPDDKTLYHMGDTDIFGDMALIEELHKPDIGIVPIGDRLTMGCARLPPLFQLRQSDPLPLRERPHHRSDCGEIRRRTERLVDRGRGAESRRDNLRLA